MATEAEKMEWDVKEFMRHVDSTAEKTKGVTDYVLLVKYPDGSVKSSSRGDVGSIFDSIVKGSALPVNITPGTKFQNFSNFILNVERDDFGIHRLTKRSEGSVSFHIYSGRNRATLMLNDTPIAVFVFTNDEVRIYNPHSGGYINYDEYMEAKYNDDISEYEWSLFPSDRAELINSVMKECLGVIW